MADVELRAAPREAMTELRGPPVAGALQGALEEARGVEDVRFDQAPHDRIPRGATFESCTDDEQERLANRRAADSELLRQLLLPKQRAGQELTRGDRVFEGACDLVGLGRRLAHAEDSSCRPFSGSKKRVH
jgi:hypothetical protein